MATKTARELIAEMEALQHELALTRCRCCNHELDVFVQPLHPKSTRQPSPYGTCRTPGCDREGVTRELSDLYALTSEQVSQFHTNKAS